MKATAKLVIALSLAAIAVASGVLTVYFATQSNQVPAADAKLNNLGYLTNYSGESKLYVVSANATYGKHDGQDCFIIYVAIRNDYTAQQPPPMDNWPGNSTGESYFGITATLFHGNEQISASDVTAPVIPALGFHQVGLNGGQTGVFEIDMATTRRNIDSYTVNLQIVAGYPIP